MKLTLNNSIWLGAGIQIGWQLYLWIIFHAGSSRVRSMWGDKKRIRRPNPQVQPCSTCRQNSFPTKQEQNSLQMPSIHEMIGKPLMTPNSSSATPTTMLGPRRYRWPSHPPTPLWFAHFLFEWPYFYLTHVSFWGNQRISQIQGQMVNTCESCWNTAILMNSQHLKMEWFIC